MKKLLSLLSIIGFLASCGTESNPTFTLTTIVSPSEGGSITPSSGDYSKGETVSLQATPSDGWSFVRWAGDLNTTTNPVDITMTRDYNILGVFERRTYSLTITIEGQGTVEESVVAHIASEYPYQTMVELTPVPSEGWEFIEWSGDLSGNEVPVYIIIEGEKNVTATFRSNVYLGENDITIMCPDVEVGAVGIIDGVEYEVVDRDLLIQRRDEGADLTKVCVSNVTDMSGMFGRSRFNQPIENWDVSRVTNMKEMFSQSEFDQPIGVWDVSNVTDMSYMFYVPSGFIYFNQEIGNWDVGNVKNMEGMFAISDFNKPIGEWDVRNVTNMSSMFEHSQFNQPIGNWDVSNVTNTRQMFSYSQFNQPIGDWNVSSVVNMEMMFWESQFNHPIGNWDVGQVTSMERMFRSSPFNQSIGNWDVSKVTDMGMMFGYTPFNQPIGNWDVGNVTRMLGMFVLSPFNQPIGDWDVSNVTTMESMFLNSQFNQNISRWCVENLTIEPFHFSTGSPLTSRNKPRWGTCPVN